mmetsp:Transcript_67600/g.171583  ORF Transcript_67600/g.171583 Transcript_67600/m.171583 type:complete len:220 (-) Transcript_67600:675-1334(-)
MTGQSRNVPNNERGLSPTVPKLSYNQYLPGECSDRGDTILDCGTINEAGSAPANVVEVHAGTITMTDNVPDTRTMNGCAGAQAVPPRLFAEIQQKTEGAAPHRMASTARSSCATPSACARSFGVAASRSVSALRASTTRELRTSPHDSTFARAVSNCGVGSNEPGVTARNHSRGSCGSGPQWLGRAIICAAKCPISSELFAAKPLPPEQIPQPGDSKSM